MRRDGDEEVFRASNRAHTRELVGVPWPFHPSPITTPTRVERDYVPELPTRSSTPPLPLRPLHPSTSNGARIGAQRPPSSPEPSRPSPPNAPPLSPIIQAPQAAYIAHSLFLSTPHQRQTAPSGNF